MTMKLVMGAAAGKEEEEEEEEEGREVTMERPGVDETSFAKGAAAGDAEEAVAETAAAGAEDVAEVAEEIAAAGATMLSSEGPG